MDARELKRLGRYEVVREIGRGAMGVVYLATDPVIGRTLAIKTVAPPPGIDPGRYREFLGRFAREARAAGSLSHPGIVTVYDAGHDAASNLSYIAMEHVRGGTLEERLRRQDVDREAVALRSGCEIVAALAYAHGRGVIHRDLKPANILLGEDGTAKITDFGVARLETSDLTREGQSLGSPSYMSPEQVLGRVADRRSDLFSLGIILYEVLSGERPFRGADLSALAYQIVHESPLPLRALDRRISPGWEPVVSRLLAKRPEDRYDDAQQLLEDLEALARGEPLRYAPSLGEPTERTVVDEGPLAIMPEPREIPAPSPGAAVPARGSSAASHLSWRDLAEEIGGRLAAAGAQVNSAAARGGTRAAGQIRTHAAPWLAAMGHAVLRRFRLHLEQALAVTGALLARISPRFVAGGRARLVPAGVACLLPLAVWIGWLAVRPGCVVAVDLRHGLERGRLQVFADGSEVVDRSFHGENRRVRMFGKDLFGRTGGSLADSFRLRPGEHEITVKVRAEDDEPLSRTFRRTVVAGSRSVLEVRVASAFAKGLGVSWESSEDD